MRLLPPLPNEEKLEINKDDLNRLLYESYKKCDTASEEVLVLKELAKINGHYEKAPTNQVNILNVTQQVHKLRDMSDEELLNMVGLDDQNVFELPQPIKVIEQD